jgi:flagellar basal-body rod protein FlgB
VQPLTAILTLKALDGLSERAAATAQNIANASTPRYRPLRVSFEDALAGAARRGEAAVSAVSPQIRAEGERGSLRLDLELATASATALRYSALIEVLNRQLQIQAVALSGSA